MTQANNKLAGLIAKRDAAAALVAKYQGDIDGLTKYEAVAVGDLVGFEFGRGEGKVNLQGEVVARGKLDNGVEVLTVLLNKGSIDADIKRIPLSTLNAWESKAASTFVPPAVTIVEGEPVDPLGSSVTSAPVVNDDPLAGMDTARPVDALIS